MLEDQETLRQFGYLASSLKAGSNKTVVYSCNKCQKLGQTKRWYYKGENHFCKKCAAAKRSFITLQDSVVPSDITSLNDKETLKLFGYLATSLIPSSAKPVIYNCSVCSKEVKTARENVKLNQKCQYCYLHSQAINPIAIKQDILSVAKSLGHAPTFSEYLQLGLYSRNTIRRNFPISWLKLLESFGLKVSSVKYCVRDVELDLKKLKARLGCIPSLKDYKEFGSMTVNEVRNVFGLTRWADILVKVFDLDQESSNVYRGNGKYIPTKEILKKLKTVATILGHSPTKEQAQTNGIHTEALYKRLKTNWAGILKAAGLELKSLPLHSQKFYIEKEDVLTDFRQVASKLGKIPIQKEYYANGKYGKRIVKKYFASWLELLNASGLDLRERYLNKKDTIVRPTNYYLELLRELADKLGHTPSCSEAENHGITTVILYRRLKTNWADIITLAGLSKKTLPKISRFFATTNQELLQDIEQVTIKLGYLPTSYQYDKEGTFNSHSVNKRFGGTWSSVLAELEKYIASYKPIISTLPTNKLNIAKTQNKEQGQNVEQDRDNISAFFKN